MKKIRKALFRTTSTTTTHCFTSGAASASPICRCYANTSSSTSHAPAFFATAEKTEITSMEFIDFLQHDIKSQGFLNQFLKNKLQLLLEQHKFPPPPTTSISSSTNLQPLQPPPYHHLQPHHRQHHGAAAAASSSSALQAVEQATNYFNILHQRHRISDISIVNTYLKGLLDAEQHIKVKQFFSSFLQDEYTKQQIRIHQISTNYEKRFQFLQRQHEKNQRQRQQPSSQEGQGDGDGDGGKKVAREQQEVVTPSGGGVKLSLYPRLQYPSVTGHSLEPNQETFDIVLRAMYKLMYKSVDVPSPSDVMFTSQVYQQMQDLGFAPSADGYSAVLFSQLIMAPQFKTVAAILREMEGHGVAVTADSIRAIANALIKSRAKYVLVQLVDELTSFRVPKTLEVDRVLAFSLLKVQERMEGASLLASVAQQDKQELTALVEADVLDKAAIRHKLRDMANSMDKQAAISLLLKVEQLTEARNLAFQPNAALEAAAGILSQRLSSSSKQTLAPYEVETIQQLLAEVDRMQRRHRSTCYNHFLKRALQFEMIQVHTASEVIQSYASQDMHMSPGVIGVLIECFGKQGAMDQVEYIQRNVLQEYRDTGMQISMLIYEPLVQAYGSRGDVTTCLQLLDEMQRVDRHSPSIKVYNGLLQCYSKMKVSEEDGDGDGDGKKVAREMVYSSEEALSEALKVYYMMLAGDISPNVKTFEYLVQTAVNAKKIQLAMDLVDEMAEVYQLQPTIAIGNAIMERYHQSGHSNKILKFVKKYDLFAGEDVPASIMDSIKV